MSKAGNSAGRSWLSNESYPASNGRDAETAESSHRPEDLPTVDERLCEIVEKYPERAMRPLSETDGRTLRADCLEEPETVDRTVETGEYETRTVSDTVSREALPWIGGVAQLLEKHESYRDKKLKLSRGSETRGDYESFLVDMDMSYSEDAAGRQYAQMEALERQFIGEKYPNGVECEGEYAEPMTLLFSLSASSLEGDEYRPPIDHDRAIRDAWSGSSDSVKRVLRDVLERKCGLEPGEYAWHFQSEPHAGGGPASGYSHAHPFVIFDAAAADGEADPMDPETFRPVVAKHVAECEGAEWAGHTLEDAVSVSPPGEIDELASYLSKYLAVGPDQDLLERSAEYLMYAASQFASSTQKYSRSRWATAAIKADRCQQQYMSEEADQTAEHGESVVRSDRLGLEFECAECGSPHGIDQSADSLARFRLNQSETAASASGGVQAVTDGGVTAAGGESGESGRTLAERWPSARSAASVGSETRERECGHEEPNTCPLCAECDHEWHERCVLCVGDDEHPTVRTAVSNEVPVPESASAAPASRRSEGFDRPPEWSPEAVVQTASGEETTIGSPGGVEYGEVVFRSRRREELGLECSLCGEYVFRPDHPEPDMKHFAFHVKSEHKEQIGPGASYESYVVDDDEPDRSGGGSDRSGRGESAGECERQLPSEVSRSIEELVRVEGVESVPAVLGRLGIDPSHREAVAAVVEECR